jgi:hydroxymethylglutaryl-CoA lyase
MKKVKIFEMFMRDGLQSLKKIYSLDQKKIFINNLLKVNMKNIEFGSTTSPKLLPQMNNSYELWKYLKNKDEYIKNKDDYKFTMLIPDKENLIKCINENIMSYGLICSLSDLFGKNNMKKTSNESFQDILNNIDIIYDKTNNLDKNNVHTRIYISCTFGTNLEKYDNYDLVFKSKLFIFLNLLLIKLKLYKIDYDNIDIVLCDTYGVLDKNLLTIVLNDINMIDKDLMNYISLHLHTNNNFYEYIDIALNYKIYKFDSSILNIGGCPFSGKKNISNMNTLELIKYLDNKNYDTSIDFNMLEKIEKDILYEMDK